MAFLRKANSHDSTIDDRVSVLYTYEKCEQMRRLIPVTNV
jgi:hypothetical protein